MRKIISFILCAAMVLSFSSVTAFADEITYKDISISADELAGTADENVKTIQKALDEARNSATDEKRYRIHLPKGRFNLNSTLNSVIQSFILIMKPRLFKQHLKVKI